VFNGVFAVPISVIDEYIKISTGDNLKVLLYCLRHTGHGLSAGEISRATGVPPDNVTTSIRFWEQRGLFGGNRENATDIIPSTVASPIEELSATSIDIKKAKVLLDRDHEFSPSEIADLINENKDVKYLFERYEELYGRPLKHNEQKALAVIIEEVGMKPEVALMLIEYCFSINKKRSDSIKKIAKSWIELGIDSIGDAESHIKQLKNYYSVESELVLLLEIKAIPDNKKPLFQKWLYEFNHSIKTIYDAYQKTLEKTGKLEYTYMDRILTGLNWDRVSGVNTSKKSAGTATSAKKIMPPPSFDLDELDKQIMEQYKAKQEQSQ
jgi:DnaD/phage-associated family protein